MQAVNHLIAILHHIGPFIVILHNVGSVNIEKSSLCLLGRVPASNMMIYYKYFTINMLACQSLHHFGPHWNNWAAITFRFWLLGLQTLDCI